MTTSADTAQRVPATMQSHMVLDVLTAISAATAMIEGTRMVQEGHAIRHLAAHTLGLRGEF